MVREALLDHVPIPGINIHPMHGDPKPEAAAKDYEHNLRAAFEGESITFDLVLLGMGTDGHTASLFPGSAALGEQGRMVTANYVEQLDSWRLTLTYPVINAAREVMILIAGEEKAEIVAKILGKDRKRYPIEGIAPANGRIRWLLDAEAGALLKQAN